MKKLPISKFDLGMIIAFVVIGLLGGGALYYLGGMLTEAQQAATAAKGDFDRYSVYHATGQDIMVSSRNQGVLKNNIDIVKGQLVPLIQTKLESKDNKLDSVEKKDPVAWKHDLDEEVRRLTSAAGVHSVKLPPNFYFAFSNYISSNPADDQTLILSKQLLVIEQITNILINAPVRSILDIQRTFEESPRSGGGAPPQQGGAAGPGAALPGLSIDAGAYRIYPYQIEFEATPASFRKVMNDFLQSPYIFVVRSVVVVSSQTVSPTMSALDGMAGTQDNSVTDKPPGEAAATVSTKGPQYIFGNQTLHVKARIDLVDWSTPAPN